MEGYQIITEKLRQFTRKFYRNELIKGSILFFAIGLLYLFFTLFIEYFLWLKPMARTTLFWFFIFVESYLFFRFILKPIFKLFGLQKGISVEASSKIIGNHFPEVQDKLLNILQLKENTNKSDLLLASIDQKSQELQPIPFVKAIDFKTNTKYLKYALIPIFIWIITLFTGNSGVLTQSLERVVNHRTTYNPPAPFSFFIQNEKLEVIQGKPFKLNVRTQGSVIPEEAKIVFNNQEYYLQKTAIDSFSFQFDTLTENTTFYIISNGIQSQNFTINVIETPTILNLYLDVKYPRYIGKRNETLQNTGNMVLPQGTRIIWKANTANTNTVSFIEDEKRIYFKEINTNSYTYSKRILYTIAYQITSSNKILKDYESLQYTIDVVKDDFPTIVVNSNIDSITRGVAQFAGKISDDYGLQKLQLVYYNKQDPDLQQTFNIPINKENVQTFFYQFPDGLHLKKGINYELFFQVFDNDGVNGSKKTKSQFFEYRQKTETEIDQELLEEQKNTINNLENNILQQQKQQKELEKIQQDIQNKKNLSFNDTKKVENFIKRQEQYKQMMQRQTDKLEENLDEEKEENRTLQEKKDELKKRIQELKKLDKQQKLLDEIAKMAEKLNKEELVKKSKELAQQNKQQERSLERILELTKRFYIEQKTMQIANKLVVLSKKQEDLSKQEKNTLEAQKKIQDDFEKLKKELDELAMDNEKLKKPIELPDTEEEKEDVEEELKKSEENLTKKEIKSANKNQKKASQRMKEMGKKMQKAMQEMEGDSMEENMDDLRNILENLVTFSFQQENLMNKFDEISTTHPDFGKDLKRQNQIKTYFEHIDDSLYVLSMRLPRISTQIQDDLSTVHYNLEQSLDNFSENRFSNGLSNQQYVMTSTNNLADYLSSILNNIKKASMKMGNGKGSGFSLPDIIKKQGDLSKKMKEGMKQGQKPGDKLGPKPGQDGKSGESRENGKSAKGGKNGKNGKNGKPGEGKSGYGVEGENDDLDGELYKIYKEQSMLRQQLQEAIKETENAGNGKPGGNAAAKKALKTMEQLENEILEKGFSTATLQKMQRLNYQLLKLDKASLEQGKDKKRKSITNSASFKAKKLQEIEFKKRFYNQTEILNRQSLPLQQNFKKKVREYFLKPGKKTNDNI